MTGIRQFGGCDLEEILKQSNTVFGMELTKSVAGLFKILSMTDEPSQDNYEGLLGASESLQNCLPYLMSNFSHRYRSFAHNVARFLETMTGHTAETSEWARNTVLVQSSFKELRKFASVKWEQFVPLYHEIQLYGTQSRARIR